MEEEKKCFNCGNTSNDAPLLDVTIKEEEKNVCGRCLPMLIHG
ncbi:MAG: hypothetical protein ACE5PM_01690 [Candidatus Hydrothermarchaeales archaeon]